MMYAYDKVYLEQARANLGRMLDFAVYDLKFDLTKFFDLFLFADIAERFGDGDFRLIAGMSGIELAYEVLEHAGVKVERVQPRFPVDRSEEYWTGWALAYYQWRTSIPFAWIVRFIPIKSIMGLYHPYHEMDIRQFADCMDELYRKAKPKTNLQIMREINTLSREELAEMSGVPVSDIQAYEEKQRNINHARVQDVVMLARNLFCKVPDLLEYV